MSILIRKLKNNDIIQCIQLFRDTVHSVNKKDYSKDQLDVWTRNANNPQYKRWQDFLNNFSFVAEINGEIVGFIEMLPSGYLDHLYVHKHHQRKGIASALLKEIEQIAKENSITEITTEASITAKPFFEARGYKVFQNGNKQVNDIYFVTFLMRKPI